MAVCPPSGIGILLIIIRMAARWILLLSAVVVTQSFAMRFSVSIHGLLISQIIITTTTAVYYYLILDVVVIVCSSLSLDICGAML